MLFSVVPKSKRSFGHEWRRSATDACVNSCGNRPSFANDALCAVRGLNQIAAGSESATRLLSSESGASHDS